MNTKEIKKLYTTTQNEIINRLIDLDVTGKKHIVRWKHKQGGGGRSCEIIGKRYIEKAAVNFSSITGKELPTSALEKTGIKGLKSFNATGVSVIVHPWNPKIPCSHMNIRFFEANIGSKNVWWFGGGFDLTPYFITEKDVLFWKNSAKGLCDKFNKNFYKEYNNTCNNYFYLSHRNEPRGIGGIFYDQLNKLDYAKCKTFLCSVLTHLLIHTRLSLIRKSSQNLRRKKEHFNFIEEGDTLNSIYFMIGAHYLDCSQGVGLNQY